MIPFTFRDRPAYIQPLPDYNERVEDLRQGRVARRVTALMVGELGDLPIDMEAVLDWLPFDFLDLLAITSGSPVGMRWIEFRDADRHLVRRIYIATRGAPFHRGVFRPIADAVNNGTGLLLSQAPTSRFWKDRRLRVVMGYLRRSAVTSVVEDRFLDLARAFEGLFRLHGLTLPTLLDQLDPDLRDEVRKELSGVARKLREIGTRVQSEARNTQSSIVVRIANRVPSAAQRSGSFGEMVVALLEQFDLPDAKILEAHYARRSPTARQSWLDDLTHYRNTAAHGTYFELDAAGEEIAHVFRMSNHMFDILLRIVFKMLNYTGTYHPPVSIITDDQSLDWVQITTQASALGYRGM